MRMKIQRVYRDGGADQEYVTLKVRENCDLESYLVADTTFLADGTLSNRTRHTFWFPSKEVWAGDYVRLYTRAERPGERTAWGNRNGTMTHAFYWGLETAVWNDEGDGAVLLELSCWRSRQA